MRQPNPLDPLDAVKRWYHELWPMQRVGAWLALAVIITILALWVSR